MAAKRAELGGNTGAPTHVNSHAGFLVTLAVPVIAWQRPCQPLEARQREKLAAFKSARDQQAVKGALESIRDVARDNTSNLLPVMVEAVKSRVTLGEISDVLREEWGVFGKPA